MNTIHESYTILLAPNASIMTGPGTNTIVLGGGVEGATVIDPADDNQEHLEAIIQAGEARGGIRRILITHGHPDHQGGAEALRTMLGAHIYGFSRKGTVCIDEEITDGMLIPAGRDTLRTIHTPGHRFDHLCFMLEEQRILFAGDMLAGTGTVVIIPPEGDMLDYLNSLRLIQQCAPTLIVPAHGPVITAPQRRLTNYIEHRLQREQQVLAVLQKQQQGSEVMDIVQQIYVDIDLQLHSMAADTITAHLLKLEREGKVQRHPSDRWSLLAQ